MRIVDRIAVRLGYVRLPVVGPADLVTLKCKAETLLALAANFVGFAPVDGAPDWLVAGAWLCTGVATYVATASVEVLADGYVARPLNIEEPDELAGRTGAELPNLSVRLLGRESRFKLPDATTPQPPATTTAWTEGPYSMMVLLRVSRRSSAVHRVACGLLFRADARQALLVGTDVSTLAMVLSQDPELIARYCANCEQLSAEDYLALCGS